MFREYPGICEKKSQTTSDYPLEEQNNQIVTSTEIDIEENVSNERIIHNVLKEEENNISDLIVFDVDIGNSVSYDNIPGYLIKIIMLAEINLLLKNNSEIIQECAKTKIPNY